jgi:hypothetical protein
LSHANPMNTQIATQTTVRLTPKTSRGVVQPLSDIRIHHPPIVERMSPAAHDEAYSHPPTSETSRRQIIPPRTVSMSFRRLC